MNSKEALERIQRVIRNTDDYVDAYASHRKVRSQLNSATYELDSMRQELENTEERIKVLHQQIARQHHVHRSQVKVIQGQRDMVVEMDKAWQLYCNPTYSAGASRDFEHNMAKAVRREPRW